MNYMLIIQLVALVAQCGAIFFSVHTSVAHRYNAKQIRELRGRLDVMKTHLQDLTIIRSKN